jgi:hypothetical protein
VISTIPAATETSSGDAAALGPRMPRTTAAEANATTAIVAKTMPGLQTSSRTPATAGATSTLALSIHPETTFVAVSSSGERASAGTRAACVGRVIVTAVAATAASA